MNAKKAYLEAYRLARIVDNESVPLEDRTPMYQHSGTRARTMALVSLLMARYPETIRVKTTIRKLFEIEKQIKDEAIIKW